MSAGATISTPIALTTNIADVPGVGSKRAGGFRKLGIRCVADLLLHLPSRYEHELGEMTIAQAGEEIGPNHGAEKLLALRGEVAAARAPLHRRAPFEATLFDGTGTVKLIWFNSPWMKGKLHPGMRIVVNGKAARKGDYIQMANPKWREEDPSPLHAGAGEEPGVRAGHAQATRMPSPQPAPRGRGGQADERLIPIYPASEAITSTQIHQAIEAVLDEALAQIEDHLHAEYRRQSALPALADAYRMVHRPKDEREAERARRRLAFDELFMLQVGVMMKRHHRRAQLQAPPLKLSAKIDEHIRARMPFELTHAQNRVVDEIARDLQQSTPMNRLLQGDVGSGKTAVALYAMLMAVASGHQAALMAPTELLAEQHLASITAMLKGARVSIELLTGSLKAAARKAIHKKLESGEIDILIGTHALLTESVNFKSLAMAVIDEQHRFGVHQRAAIRAKASDANSTPHMLVMTATPIPRTMSLTIFGDLDISTIKGMPPGRKPIITRHVSQAKAGDVYDYVAKQVKGGSQAYVVVPVIDETDRGLKDVKSHLDWLRKGPLRGCRLEAMHGRLLREQRETIMNSFRAGKIDALVATTVIEVGVDVPNASMMVIEHAERFGLAQLHQLRGRIGRGARKSLCVLIAEPTTEDGKARIDAIVSTNDGFKIAEKDLEIRGPGELLGLRQSGDMPFRAAELPRDMKLLEQARRDAAKWIAANPTLAGDRDALLRKRLIKAHGEWLGLADVA